MAALAQSIGGGCRLQTATTHVDAGMHSAQARGAWMQGSAIYRWAQSQIHMYICDIQVGASPSTLQILVYHHHALQRVLRSGLLQVVVATTSSTEQSLRWPGAWMQWCRAQVQVQVQSAGAATEVPWCLDAV